MKKQDQNNASRRDFVINGSLMAGGLMTAPLLSKANFFSGAEDTIKVAVVGCGGRGTGAAMQALSSKQNVKIVATVGLDGYGKAILHKGSWLYFATDLDPSREDVQSEYNMYLNKYLLRIRFKLGVGLAFGSNAVVAR
jgi:hypothetical protein